MVLSKIFLKFKISVLVIDGFCVASTFFFMKRGTWLNCAIDTMTFDSFNK